MSKELDDLLSNVTKTSSSISFLNHLSQELQTLLFEIREEYAKPNHGKIGNKSRVELCRKLKQKYPEITISAKELSRWVGKK